jgi:ribosomal protein S18 acetylase RimI-like enzyme
MTEHYAVRPARLDDLDALYEICLKTADSGVDATELYGERHLPGYVWSAPYGVLEPDFAFMLATPERAVGYVIATPDTAAFYGRLDQDWWPDVRKKVAGLTPTRELDAMVLDRIAHPEQHAAWLQAEYPAHLHINVLPEAQSSGMGRRMIETELAALKAHGVAGVHLGVSLKNERAKGFYRHVGFDDISRDGHVLFGMKFR